MVCQSDKVIWTEVAGEEYLSVRDRKKKRTGEHYMRKFVIFLPI
jgi:hypothetical protein